MGRTIPALAVNAIPSIFHITHWKAGSQWIHRILNACAHERIVPPSRQEAELSKQCLTEGMVYPTVYRTRQEFDRIVLPPHWRRFLVIRDLRDTLISAYFSIKTSHPFVGNPELDASLGYLRGVLTSVSIEEGLLHLLAEWLDNCARIQASWLETGVLTLHYEDLLEGDTEILARLLLDYCRLPLTRERLHEIILGSRFEKITAGRSRGQENTADHYRKGVAGDWRNYFTDRIKQAFKRRFGELLVATGYESDLNW